MANDKSTFQQAVDLALRGKWPEARRLLQRIVEQKNDDDQVWLWLADSYTSDEARLAILQYGLRRHPDSDHLMQALELQLEKMNNAAAASAQTELRPDEPDTADSESQDSPETHTASTQIEPLESSLPEPPEEVLPNEFDTTQSAETAEEQQAAQRWEADDFIIRDGEPAVEPQNLPESLTGETRPSAEPQPLTAPETLQEPAPADSVDAKPLRPVLATAIMIILIIVLAYVVTRLW